MVTEAKRDEYDSYNEGRRFEQLVLSRKHDGLAITSWSSSEYQKIHRSLGQDCDFELEQRNK